MYGISVLLQLQPVDVLDAADSFDNVSHLRVFLTVHRNPRPEPRNQNSSFFLNFNLLGLVGIMRCNECTSSCIS